MSTMPAIAAHGTMTSKKSWDGPANEGRLKNDAGARTYRLAFAWIDPEGDPDTKAAYRFIHHEVSEAGAVGAANVQACRTGIGVLNGGRGGTTIPAADRQGVYAHLARHLRDADVEPPPLRSLESNIEQRVYPLDRLEVRESDPDGDGPLISGHAALFDKLSEPIMGLFRERIEPGAFRRTLKVADVRALFNHDPNFVLGRNTAGTLTLAEDMEGLAIQARPPATSWAADLMVSMQRGDINQMSFGFQVTKDRWEKDAVGGDIRTLVEVKLFDVSVVTFPAYLGTSVSARSLLAEQGLDLDELETVLARLGGGYGLDEAGRLTVRAAVEYLENIAPVAVTAPVQQEHTGDPQTAELHSLDALRRHLDLLERIA